VKFKEFLEVREAEVKAILFDVSAAAYVVSTAATSAVYSVTPDQGLNTTSVGISLPEPFAEWETKKANSYAAKLAKLDPELGRLYGSVWPQFYGGTGSSERSALLAMREAFDQFFRLLAPDDKVRKSKYFKTKTGNNETQVWRRERMEFALNEWIADSAMRDLLRAQVTAMLDQYNELNKLHKDGKLDRDNTKKTLLAMEKLMEQWIDARKL